MTRLEEQLAKEAQQAVRELQGLRQPRTHDVFQTRLHISPKDLKITNYLRSKPLAAFNPGALLQGDRLLIFPRLVFDYYCYCSSIGVFSLDLHQVLERRIETPLETRVILWPEKLWEFGHGCEDPRVFRSPSNSTLYMLYTGSKHYTHEGQLIKKSVLALAEFAPEPDWKLLRRGYLTVREDGEEFLPDNKDSTVVAFTSQTRSLQATVLTRPDIITSERAKLQLCWRADADFSTLTLCNLEPVLAFEPWELKVGWSTNAVPLSSDDYLVGWHAVLKDDLSYRNGLALVDAQGRLKAISDYLLVPRGLNESYGDRPLVTFGCGLVLYKEHLIWVGGLSDYAIGIFTTKLGLALEQLRKVRT